MPRPHTKTRTGPARAADADRYQLYLASVQCPEHEVAFLSRIFKRQFNRAPRILREDFCGTAAVCYEWVKADPTRYAIGVDLDPEPLAWGQEFLAPAIPSEDMRRVQLLQQDVRLIDRRKADIVAAQNFSFFCFKTRSDLLRYFDAARQNLADEGMLVLDMMGGSETMEPHREDRRRVKNFTYVWEQHRFDPITHDTTYFIHFEFRDGSALRRAFRYDWRLWTIPEVRDILIEAGFSRVDVHWEGTDRATGKGNDRFSIRKKADADPSWIAYLVAIK
jgi:hypothetical protein